MVIILIWIVNAVTLLIVSSLVPGFEVASFYNALIASLVLGLVNALVRPILLLLTLPINLLTLGLFTLVINGLMIWLVATIVKGVDVTSFGAAVWAAIILWLISLASNWLASRAKQA